MVYVGMLTELRRGYWCWLECRNVDGDEKSVCTVGYVPFRLFSNFFWPSLRARFRSMRPKNFTNQKAFLWALLGFFEPVMMVAMANYWCSGTSWDAWGLLNYGLWRINVLCIIIFHNYRNIYFLFCKVQETIDNYWLDEN